VKNRTQARNEISPEQVTGIFAGRDKYFFR